MGGLAFVEPCTVWVPGRLNFISFRRALVIISDSSFGRGPPVPDLFTHLFD